MMRPKKPRYLDGTQLADNLYLDPRKRPGHYSYHRPDGSRRSFTAPSIAEANRVAEEANAIRDSFVPEPVTGKAPTRGMTKYHLPAYVLYREKVHPGLKAKASWKNRKYTLQQFAEAFPMLGDIEITGIRTWWDELTHSQQKLRMAEFRRLFNWLMGECLVPRIKYNPFTTADDVSRLLLKEKAAKRRMPLTEIQYQKIYKKAGEMGMEALQIAMAISLYTTLRESDVCALRFDRHISDDELRTVVSKSDAQKGSARATRLCWKLEDHSKLRKTIAQAREHALKNGACPYLVSHRPIRRTDWKDRKEHLCQVLPDRLSRMFAEVRDECKISNTSFHEVRGLSMTMMRQAGYTVEQIQRVAAHESTVTTKGYLDGDALPYEIVALTL